MESCRNCDSGKRLRLMAGAGAQRRPPIGDQGAESRVSGAVTQCARRRRGCGSGLRRLAGARRPAGVRGRARHAHAVRDRFAYRHERVAIPGSAPQRTARERFAGGPRELSNRGWAALPPPATLLHGRSQSTRALGPGEPGFASAHSWRQSCILPAPDPCGLRSGHVGGGGLTRRCCRRRGLGRRLARCARMPQLL